MNRSVKNSRWLIAAGAVAAMGLSAYVVSRKTARAEADNPPQGRFIEVDGVTLHYTEHGNAQAPALVILHGMGSMGQEMLLSGLIELAESQYRVLVFDRPGYGHSDRPVGNRYDPEGQAQLFLKALDLLGIERPVVMSHSWATLIALYMAKQAPSALKGLVLAGGYYTPSVRLDVLGSSVPAIPLLGPLMARTLSPIVSRLVWPLLSWRVFSPAPRSLRRAFTREYPLWMALRPEALRTAAQETAMLLPEAIKLSNEDLNLDVPVVLVAGKQDRLLMTNWHSARLHERLPNSRLHVVDQAGHMVHHAAPEMLLHAVREVSSLVNTDTPVDLEASTRLAPEDEPYQTAAIAAR
ncbi:MAG: alpha/beta fold hydrolase [Acidobacteriota bacterium]